MSVMNSNRDVSVMRYVCYGQVSVIDRVCNGQMSDMIYHFQNFNQAELIFITQIVILFVYTYLILFCRRLCQHN